MSQNPKTVSPAARRHLVAELLRNQIISSQEDLVHALEDRGIVVTQTTASRDLESLGAVRARDVNGHSRYFPAADIPSRIQSTPAANKGMNGLVLEVLASANLAVVKTPPGGAQFLAGQIDSAIKSGAMPRAIGTIAGDDTIFVVSKSPIGGKDLVHDIWKFSGGQEPKAIKSTRTK